MEEDNNDKAIEQELLKALTAQLPAQEWEVSEGTSLQEGDKIASIDEIIKALRTISDPEIMINIYDLGLIYDIRQKDNGDVVVDMSLTSPTCPVAGILPVDAVQALACVEGVGIATVRLVWEPAWTPERMTEEGKMILQMY